jgi:hypothetical protein
MRPQQQMTGVDAARVVAGVPDNFFVDIDQGEAICFHVSKAVQKDFFSLEVRSAVSKLSASLFVVYALLCTHCVAPVALRSSATWE